MFILLNIWTIKIYHLLFLIYIILDNYERVGCVKEISGRILREKAGNLKPNSPWHCQKFCAGYRYFGVEVRVY